MTGELPPARAGRLLAEFTPGTLIGGYRIESRIGAGGMAAVFRARDESLGRFVALKVLDPAATLDEEFRQRFIRESRAASAVDHPNIIPVHAAGEDAGVLYLAMRYVPGGDLHSVVERDGPLPADRALSLLAPVASALDAAHGAGIVHRDVKPANILIDHSPGRPDHPYLSDFGLARGTAPRTLTSAGAFVGTAGFASPEQLSGRPVTPETDQYALACVVFTVLTASLPFRHGDPQVALWAQMSSPPPRVTERRLDLSRAVDHVIARALARDPSERYSSCGEFAAALRQALIPPGASRGREPTAPPESIAQPATSAGTPISPADRALRGPTLAPYEPPGRYRPGPRHARSRSIAMAGAAVLVVAAAAGTAMLLRGGMDPHDAAGARSGRAAAGPGTPAPTPGSTGPVRLAATLDAGTGWGAITVAFGQGDMLRAFDRTGSVSTFDITSRRATERFSLGSAGSPRNSDLAAARFSLDGSALVLPEATCAAGGSSGSCFYAVSGVGARHRAWPVSGGTGPVFSTGNYTMAVADAQRDGVDMWNLRSGKAIATSLSDPDQGVVRAAAIDPSGEAVAVSSGSGGPAHHVYWWALEVRAVVATETVPRMMGVPWAGPGVSGLPMGLVGQTLALSDGQATDIYRAPPDEPTRTRMHQVLGGLMAVSPDDGNFVATLDQSSADGVDLWDATTGARTAALSLPAPPSVVAFSADGGSVAVGCSNGSIYVWRIR